MSWGKFLDSRWNLLAHKKRRGKWRVAKRWSPKNHQGRERIRRWKKERVFLIWGKRMRLDWASLLIWTFNGFLLVTVENSISKQDFDFIALEFIVFITRNKDRRFLGVFFIRTGFYWEFLVLWWKLLFFIDLCGVAFGD